MKKARFIVFVFNKLNSEDTAHYNYAVETVYDRPEIDYSIIRYSEPVRMKPEHYKMMMRAIKARTVTHHRNRKGELVYTRYEVPAE